jgi:O-methyltransferase involved in polyketide biosynthesis
MTTKKEPKIDASDLDDGSGVTWTLLATLFMRAWDSRAEPSILGDHHAAEAIDRIDYDYAWLERRIRPESGWYLAVLRARRLDDWSADFLARHPDATVLQLGCGLDSRMLRLDPPPTVRWFDLDIPRVIELRRRLYPERDGYQMIGASVTDPDWLEQVPADRPVLIIAEGLLPYLTVDETRRLLRRLTDHFDSGELIFDALAPGVARMSKPFKSGIRDGRQVERWNPRLTCVEQPLFGAQFALIPVRRHRALYRLGNSTPGWRSLFKNFRFTIESPTPST